MNILSIELYLYKRLALAQINYIKLTPNKKIQIILGTNGSGKAQPLSSPIKTPSGWDLMKNMKIGTEVIAKDGTTTKVNGVFPQGLKQIFKVTFGDGRMTRVTADHLWKIYKGGRVYPIEPRVMPTSEVIQLLNSKTYHNLIWVDLIDSEKNDDAELPIDPYVLGVLLGDGCLSAGLTITNPDQFILDKITDKLENGLLTTLRKTDNHCLTYGLCNGRRLGPKSNYLINYLREVGLLYKRSYEKFIPEIYLHGSTKQRLELLQGLMDTDGTIDTQGTPSYSTTSLELAQNVQYLVRSLGGMAAIAHRRPFFTYKGEKREGRLAYQINIRYKKPSELFTLPRKKERANDDNQYSATLKLRIVSIEEDGYELAQCISIDHPEHLYVTNNFIVTHNSSILKELSPLPAVSADYAKEGYKIIEIAHNDAHYVLKSVFSPSQRHSFIKDGIELNPSGTGQVQKELVRSHFNITPDIHDLITGSMNFHSMTVAERRHWFTQLSDTSYTYAISVYQKLREKQRDLQGAIKLSQTRLVQESTKLLTPEQETLYREEVQKFRELLEILFQSKIHNLRPAQELKASLETENKTLNDLVKLIQQNRLKLKGVASFQSIEAIDQAIIEQQSIALSKAQRISELAIIVEDKQNITQALEMTNVSSIGDIDKHILQLTTLIAENQSAIRIPLAWENVEMASQALSTVSESLLSVFSQIEPNADRGYNRTHYQQLLNQKQQYEQELKAANHQHGILLAKQKELEHLKTHDQIECPKCQHRWYYGYDEVTHRQVLESIVKSADKLTNLQGNLDKTSEDIAKVTEYLTFLRVYLEIVNNWKSLKPLWDYIEEHELVYKDPRRIVKLLDTITVDLTYASRIVIFNKDIEEFNKLKELTAKSSQEDLQKIHIQLEEAQAELHKANEQLQQAKALADSYTNYRSIAQSSLEAERQFTQLLQERSELSQEFQEHIKVTYINNVVTAIQLELSKRESALSQVDVQKGIVMDIENNLKVYEEENLVLKAMIAELSPTDGLIAKGMLGFINSFVKQMNIFIRKVWLYPLELIPIMPDESDNVDLDYKFAVKVNDGSIIPDVTKASTAMKEITNLAFRIVSLKYLRLSNWILILDELGASFDKAHRDNVSMLIQDIIAESEFSQIFIVSHYEEMYGSFRNTDITVLCPANIPAMKHSAFNQAVEIR